MSPRRTDDPRSRQLRRQLALEAARLLAGGEADDVGRALRKAANRLGVRDESVFPGVAEVREAIAERQRLFGTPRGDLRQLREEALEAMAFFQAFQPRLAGPVLDGSAGPDAAVRLHLHAADPDEVARFLHDQGIPAEQGRVRLRLERDHREDLPCWEFRAGEVNFELVVLPASALRQPPLEPLDGTALPLANAATLRRLLASEGDAGD